MTAIQPALGRRGHRHHRLILAIHFQFPTTSSSSSPDKNRRNYHYYSNHHHRHRPASSSSSSLESLSTLLLPSCSRHYDDDRGENNNCCQRNYNAHSYRVHGQQQQQQLLHNYRNHAVILYNVPTFSVSKSSSGSSSSSRSRQCRLFSTAPPNKQNDVCSSNNDNNNISSNKSSILSKEAATASIDYPTSDRFWALPPAIAIHLAIGSVYVYSMWSPGMSKTLGVIAAAPSDWTHSALLPVFSTSAIVLGLTTSSLGAWVERVGPRTAGMVGSAFWSAALVTTAAGVETQCLPLVYAGYGLLGGVGWGLMYLTPVTSAMKWFPDRRGLATGIALSAFGAGAALAPSVIHALVDTFAVAPHYIGDCMLTATSGSSAELVELTTLSDGSQVVASNSPVGEPGTPVVIATEADIAKSSSGLTTGPGVYAIGTGDTGIAKAMASLGILYGMLGAVGSRFMQIPHPDWKPEQMQDGTNVVRKDDDGDRNKVSKPSTNNAPAMPEPSNDNNNIGLPASYVTTNTTQFPLLWLSVFGNATGGLALLSSSKLMLTDIFAGVAPEMVTPAFTTGYVSALGIGMALGRFGWSAISDGLGRQNTFAVFGLGIPIVGLAPYLCHAVVDMTSLRGVDAGGVDGMVMGGGEVWPYLMTFYGGSVLAITFYGGIFSVLPAYIADLFGQKHAGAIHGKALTAWASSAVAGPMGLAYLRSYSYDNAMQDLLHTVEAHDASALDRSFGVSISDTEGIQKLVDAKTLTIEKLLELAPPGTVDPTPFLYDTTCYLAAALMSVAALSNLAIRPLDLSKELKKMETLQKIKA
eukprot:CAMPEP_0183730648 /NCGR_PEP_ID=MMETSP0737-20130205/33401_1 /TAXON_ID=385413 /ORGANISM="Thalassiosira miniscula, Strain CCMP1093" /LENGTH=809 /DNA_ID=CAMNT_0025963199 /DNA_START=89 /DNA_END=2518 /DNA_ORIENTATION=-